MGSQSAVSTLLYRGVTITTVLLIFKGVSGGPSVPIYAKITFLPRTLQRGYPSPFISPGLSVPVPRGSPCVYACNLAIGGMAGYKVTEVL